METELALSVANQLEQNARTIEQYAYEYANHVRQLETSWQGGGAREAFFLESNELKRRLDMLTRELVELQSRLV